VKEIVKSGRTADEAIEAALLDLGVDRDKVLIEVIEEGNKGLFGILGGKEAKVRVSLKELSPEECAKDFLGNILDAMNVSGVIDVGSDENGININVSGDDMGVLIGRRGETLNALQYLTGLVVNKKTEDYVRVNLDTENYRKKREETLINLANKLAERAIRYRKNVMLEPMNPYERRIIHASLQNNSQVTTYSTGEDTDRRVVISYKGGRR